MTTYTPRIGLADNVLFAWVVPWKVHIALVYHTAREVFKIILMTAVGLL